MGRFEIHSALPVMLILMGGLFFLLSFRAGFEEFGTVAITLPVVWAGSLVVRLAAQQLAIGDFAHDARTIVGPTGNVQTEYEFLPPRASLAYALSGQLASIGLMSIGMVVGAAMEPTSASEGLTTAELLDFRGGWSSRAWASQILWVNVFLFVLHLLPTVPFDLRAAAFAAFSRGSRSVQEPMVFRRLALLDSHLAAVLFGIGLASAALGWSLGREIAGWYAFFAAAVYLFVASQWEQARADDLQEQYVPATRVAAQQPQLRRTFDDLGGAEAVDALLSETEDYGEVLTDAEEPLVQPETLDIDEILRKVYRSGVESLSPDEQQALLSASRKIQDKRNSM